MLARWRQSHHIRYRSWIAIPWIAEEVKLQHGYAIFDEIEEDDAFNIVAFGSEQPPKYSDRVGHIEDAPKRS